MTPELYAFFHKQELFSVQLKIHLGLNATLCRHRGVFKCAQVAFQDLSMDSLIVGPLRLAVTHTLNQSVI